MRYTLVALLMMCLSIGTSAQKHDVYADVGICGVRINLGVSATYNYKVLRWLGLGAGAHVYDFFPTVTHEHRYIPAVYGDIRFNIRPEKKNQFFAFLDIGVDFYKKSDFYIRSGDYIYYVPLRNGNYTGLGIGYARTVTQRGGGIYTTLKIIDNGYSANTYNIVTGEKSTGNFDRGTIVLSFGFRF